MNEKLHFQFNSKFENIYEVERSILNRAQEYQFDCEACFNLRLAMDEAFVNAIVHGNRNREDKKIHVVATFDLNSVSVSVRDEGEGFDQTKLLDPREETNLYNTHGRGVFLIRQFTNDVRFNDKGNEITFSVFRDRPIPVMQSR